MDKLKSVCKKCTAATIKVYWNNVKRLHGEGEVKGTGWLHSHKVKKAYLAKPLKVRRHLSTAGAKMEKAYKSKKKYWHGRMEDDSEAYKKERGKNTKSQLERTKWLKQGYKAIRKGAGELWRKIKRSLEVQDPSLKLLYRYQGYILLRLYAEFPLRNTYASFQLKDSGKNNFVQNPYKGKMSFVIRQHKTSKSSGTTRIELSRSASLALRKFLKYRKPLIEGDHVFSTIKGSSLSKSALSKLVHRVTKENLGKALGSRIIRVLAVSAEKEAIQRLDKLAKTMLHSTSQQKEYLRKDDTD